MTCDDARDLLMNELSWPAFMIDIGIRADFCCEYCGKDLLTNVDAYDSWQKDHIVPNGGDGVDNLAVSCRTCNFVKRKTDPSIGLDSPDRAALIRAARLIVQERRQEKELILSRTIAAVDVIRNSQ